jgi:tRNA (guanine37-N1)-methyltransferase
MRISVVTIFPMMIQGFLSEGIVARAIGKGLVDVNLLNLRDFTTDNYRTVDDYPYGGGPGMVMKAEPILRAVGAATGLDFLGGAEAQCGKAGVSTASARAGDVPEQMPQAAPDAVSGATQGVPAATPNRRIVILSPQGRKFTQGMARELSRDDSLVLICGRYKAIDERVKDILGAEEVSVGDYVLSGGELAAMVIIESAVRLLPGAMEDEDSAAGDSFEDGLLDSAYYTRPEEVGGMRVPEVLLSGNHEAIRKWRRKSSLERTLDRRPELLGETALSKEDKELLNDIDRIE